MAGRAHAVHTTEAACVQRFEWTWLASIHNIHHPMTSPTLAAALEPLRSVARRSNRIAGHAGRFAFLMRDLFIGMAEWRIWLPRTMDQATNIGYGSLAIVLLVAGFAGAVTALQTGYQFTSSVIPTYYAGGVVTAGVVLELGPVLTGLILAGRIGARYAAELGTMRVTEQIDALESLGRSPTSHLILPRVMAGFVMIPVLTVLANVMGVASGWFSMRLVLPITDADFGYGARVFWQPFAATYSVIKSFFFAGAITVISCYMGF